MCDNHIVDWGEFPCFDDWRGWMSMVMPMMMLLLLWAVLSIRTEP
jgi:hypothetical protein